MTFSAAMYSLKCSYLAQFCEFTDAGTGGHWGHVLPKNPEMSKENKLRRHIAASAPSQSLSLSEPKSAKFSWRALSEGSLHWSRNLLDTNWLDFFSMVFSADMT